MRIIAQEVEEREAGSPISAGSSKERGAQGFKLWQQDTPNAQQG